MQAPTHSLRAPARLASLALCAAACTFSMRPAEAQSFETFYGEDPTADFGADVKSVNRCPGGGSIMVGSRRVPLFGTDLLLTRVDANGSSLWQRAYRLGGSRHTRGEAIVELRDGSGFAITGSMLRGNTDLLIHVLKVDCNGRPVWTTVLANQGNGHRASGYDLIETRGPLQPGFRPDLVIVGDETLATSGQQHGRIIRLDALGGLVYSHAYAEPSGLPGLRFRAVDENFNLSGQYGDLVLAGSFAASSSWGFDRRALLFRVTAAGIPVCNALLGAPDRANEDYFGLTSQHSAAYQGETIAVGASAEPIGVDANAVYLTRFRAGACVPVVQTLWHDPFDGAIAYDVVEAPRNPAQLDGAVAAVGSISGTTTRGDGFTLLAHPATLAPAWTPIRFGTQGRGAENLVAIDTLNDRFVLAGSTDSDWNGTGNPLDFYLVQTTQGMRTQCAVPWQHRWFEVRLPYERFQPGVHRLDILGPVRVEVIDTRGEGYCCALIP